MLIPSIHNYTFAGYSHIARFSASYLLDEIFPKLKAKSKAELRRTYWNLDLINFIACFTCSSNYNHTITFAALSLLIRLWTRQPDAFDYQRMDSPCYYFVAAYMVAAQLTVQGEPNTFETWRRHAMERYTCEELEEMHQWLCEALNFEIAIDVSTVELFEGISVLMLPPAEVKGVEDGGYGACGLPAHLALL